MSASSTILRGPAAAGARPVALAERAPAPAVQATGPWAERADEARQAARAEGFAQGRAEGLRHGQAEARAEVQARTERALRALEAGAERLAVLDAASVADVGGRVVELAVELAGLVLQREVAISDDPGLEALRRVLAEVPDTGELQIRLHPADVATLGSYQTLAPGRTITIVTDPALASGDAVVDCGPSRIDGRLDQAMARVARALRGEVVAA